MPSKYRITTNGEDYRVEEFQPFTRAWKNRFAFHFKTKAAARDKIRELEKFDAERRHQWTVVDDGDD